MRRCKECGETFRSRQYNAEFCGTPCRRDFNNRRAQRGALLLDLKMIETTDPDAFKRMGLEGRAEAAVADWLREDREQREGRTSWKRANDVAMDTVRFHRG